jgi:aromatic-L-amino-acid decarboxylase
MNELPTAAPGAPDHAVVPHMDPALFADLTQRTAAWLRRYHSDIESRPVLSRSSPGDLLASLPLHPPAQGLAADPRGPREAWSDVFDDLDRLVMPGLTHWQSPSFFGFFPSNTSEPAMLGEMLSAGLCVQGMLWLTSPACTELEMRVMDWLGEAIGLPEAFLFRSGKDGGHGGGVIQGTASDAVLAAMVAARRGAVISHRTRSGADAKPSRPELVAYTSSQAHSSILKAAMVAGIADGPDDHTHVRMIEVDEQFRMSPSALLSAMEQDIAAGRTPFFVAVTLGTTGVTAVDPLAEIVHALRASSHEPIRDAWVHIDAAHSGAMLVCPEHRWMIEGVEHADSFCFNPHKWLLTGFDCDAFWVRDRRRLIDAMSVTPEYLRNEASQSGQVVDYRDWHVPLGRRFRSLKLWLVMRHYGLEGLQAYIRNHLQLATWLEEQVRADTRFELLAPRTTNLICFGLRPRSEADRGEANVRTRQLLERINASGKAYVSHTVLPSVGGQPGRYVIRVAIGATRVEQRHVTAFWNLVLGLVDDTGSVVDV